MGLIRSPDGRVWKLDRLRPKLSDAETFKVPYFWPSVVVTVALLAGIVWLVARDPGPTAYLFLIQVERRIAEAIEVGRPETDVKGEPLVRSG